MTARSDVTSHRYVEHLMGMPVSLALRGRHTDDRAARDAWAACVADLHEIDRIFSTYREDSFVSRLARGEVALPSCPDAVREVLDLGEQARVQSGGAFNVRRPAPDGSVALDPSGVVKGWAVQRASRRLLALDDTDVCLSAGGDMVCHVNDDGRPAWRVGIEDPQNPSRLLAVVSVRRGGVATSGHAHRGRHVVDARSGRPPAGVAQVTVVRDELTWADLDATAAYALGEGAADWLRTRAGAGLVVDEDGTTDVVGGSLDDPHREIGGQSDLSTCRSSHRGPAPRMALPVGGCVWRSSRGGIAAWDSQE